MNIVILDGYTTNPGDLSWEEFQSLGQCSIYDRTSFEEVIHRAKHADVLITNKCIINRDTISALKNLKYIGVLATGYNVVDIEAAKERGIPVTNIPAYATQSVAQMTMALLLELTQHVSSHSQTVRDGRWSNAKDWCYWDYPLIELAGKIMGIIGFGRIGRTTAKIVDVFGMSVLAYDKYPQKDFPGYVQMSDLDTIFKESDVISLHCPLTEDNKYLLNSGKFAMMKSSALILNTSRGPLINEKDLAEALNNGIIAGAGLDVLSKEPPDKNNPLFQARNCIITPHLAWATKSARTRLMKAAADNIRSYLAGQTQNVVNGI